MPFNQIQYNMEIQQKLCHGAPFYVLGPLVTDIAPGYDHITSAIGGCAAAFYGASFLCYVTPREHLGLPNTDDVRTGVVAAKIAAHAGDVARGLKGVAERDRTLSVARGNLDWTTHIGTSLDPQTADRMHKEACKEMGMAELAIGRLLLHVRQALVQRPNQQGSPASRQAIGRRLSVRDRLPLHPRGRASGYRTKSMAFNRLSWYTCRGRVTAGTTHERRYSDSERHRTGGRKGYGPTPAPGLRRASGACRPEAVPGASRPDPPGHRPGP